MSSPSSLLQRPEAIDRVAAKLRTYPGVLGVFWGHRRTRGRWTPELVACVHVMRKGGAAAASEAIPPRIDGVATDVLEVGSPRLHAVFDTSDSVHADGRFGDRSSSMTAVSSPTAGETWALVSGHGTLPVVDGELVRALPGGGTGPDARLSVADRAGWRFQGRLVAGALAGDVDYGLARFDGLDGPPVLAGNLLARAPIAVQQDDPVGGQPVFQYGIERGDTLPGEIVQASASGDPAAGIPFALPGGQEVTFHDLLVVRSDPSHGRFSAEGESGSLVVNARREAVGTVVGGSHDGSVSYVLRIEQLLRALGAQASLFFEVNS